MDTHATSHREEYHALVVDDSLTNLRLLSGILKDQGITPRPISCGRLALAMAKADPPDLVLLDIDMPEMNGYEVCQAFRADPALAAIPIIFISGITDTSGIVKALELGGSDYITKPFQAEEVAARVQLQLRILRLQRQVQAQNQTLERQVAERTAALAEANHRLQELSALKNEFFQMFAHEIRTPANGLLGMSDLILDLCPPSHEMDRYRSLYDSSKERLLRLIEDMTLIANLTAVSRWEGDLKPIALILHELKTTAPDIRLEITDPKAIQAQWVRDERGLLVRSLAAVAHLASCFLPPCHCIPLKLDRSPNGCTMRFGVEAFNFSKDAQGDFFRLESTVRSASQAESLGLAPVAARSILLALGGDLRMVEDFDGSSYLRVDLPLEPSIEESAREAPTPGPWLHSV